ncbi:MAG TPA: two-component regulator propeller domain-containing protein [Bacteroidales bacterium]|nr:two-component regulator propeller domain-containing protein [Bacteroidales bacterium]
MFPGKTIKTASTFLMCFFLFSAVLYGQKFGFRNYTIEYGIPDGFVYTINQSADGFLWVGTGKGIARFDGFNFYKTVYPDSIQSRNPGVSFRDSRGTIWFGCNDGTVFYSQGTGLKKLNLDNSRSISQIMQGPDSMVYIVPQGGAIFSLDISNKDTVRQFLIPEEHTLFCAAFDNEGRILAGTQGNILVLDNENDSLVLKNVIKGFEYSAVNSICNTGSGSYLVGTADNGLFILKNGAESTPERLEGYPEFSSYDIRSILRDHGEKFWISTFGAGVIQFRLDKTGNISSLHRYNTKTGLQSDYVRLTFLDSENNYWFGLFGEGLSMLVSYAFGFYTPGETDTENNIIYVKDSGNNYLLGTPAGYHLFDADNGISLSFTSLTSRIGNVAALSYFLDGDNRLWIGTSGKGLYVREPGGSIRLFYKTDDSGADEVRDVQVDQTHVWLATTNGLIVLDKKSGKELRRFVTDQILPVNFINKILLSDGGVFIGTENDKLAMVDRNLNLGVSGCEMTGSTKNRILALSKDKEGTIWTATYGNGVFACNGDSVRAKTRSNGLFSNFCYSILADSRNNIWIGHEKSFSVIDAQTGIVKSYGAEYAQGGICNPGGIFESSDGKIFIGTTSGVVIYNSREENTTNIPPYNNITSITINDKEYPYAPLISLPYGNYRVTINFSGINFSDPERVYYSTWLENFDKDYSLMNTERKVTYRLGDGRYKFHLVSVDENGLSNDPVSFTILIGRPIYKKWWFIALLVLAAAGSVALIIREREKSHRKLQAYLEDELEKRTSVIMKQKGEIELQNLEITDSINYAKRIQSSILPDIGKLRENFREAFILFHPRDIVSGDFYWFDKVDEDRFIVVCADSTGHGVPGAFMSMIGSTLLQDIVTRKKITRPSQVLSLLDKQIFSTLNQNVDLGVSNDGMDMVVCEFNLTTRHIRFASAMRPIILVISGESYYIKGNRSSVGGESVIDKYFDDQEYYLNEGDTIYFFSDGLPDQFGGVDGKKMKIARLKKLIDQIIKLPMSEQEQSVAAFYNEWKGNHEQVDDILMMGIRV